MTTAEKIELMSIPPVGVGFWLLAFDSPDKLDLGTMLAGMSILLLLQGLVRDLWLLANRGRAQPSPPRVASCMCVETTLGVTGLVAGAILLGAGIGRTVVFMNWGWSIAAMATMTAGFLIKDLVIYSRPWQIRRDKEHMNIVFAWKR